MSLPDNMYEHRPDHGESEVVTTCRWCASEIVVGDKYYKIDGKNICEDCIEAASVIADKE